MEEFVSPLTLLLVLACLAAALVVPIIGILLFRHAEAGFAWVAMILLLETSFREMPGFSLGISLYPQDVGYLLLFIATFVRIIFDKRALSIPLGWMLFGCVLLVSFFTGLPQFGKTAGVAFRTYFYTWCAVSYASTFPYDEAKAARILAGAVWIAIWIQLMVLLRWFGDATGVWFFAPPEGGWADQPFRVVNSYQALAVGDGVLIGLCLISLKGELRFARLCLPVFALTVIVLQHRSVWLAVLAGVAAAMRLGKDVVRSASLARTAVVSLATAAIVVVAALTGSHLAPLTESVGESARRAAQLEDTAGWRLYSWQQLMAKWAGGGLEVLVLGFPFGTSMERYSFEERNQAVSVQAHNAYVQTAYNTGLLGIACFLLFSGRVVAALWHRAVSEADPGVSQAFLVLIVCQLVFYVAYGVSPFQAVFLGVAAGYLRSNQMREHLDGGSPERVFATKT